MARQSIDENIKLNENNKEETINATQRRLFIECAIV